MGKNKVKISITLDEEVDKQLRLAAERDERNVSQYINRTLKKKFEAMRRREAQKEGE